MKNILVPIDFSPISRRVEREAVTFSRGLGVRPVFLHVVQAPMAAPDFAGMTLTDTAQFMADARRFAARRLVRLRAKLRAQRVNAGTILESGPAVPCILAEARKLKASHIVIGSHGHSALHDLLVGSTAQGVIKGAACPVVIVPVVKAKRTAATRGKSRR